MANPTARAVAAGPATRPRRRPRGRLRRLAALAGLLAAGPLAWLGWREWDPVALREASAASRRGDLDSAYRRASAHLAVRPMSHAAALIAARSLGGLGRAGEAEAYYRKAGRLDLDTLHDRAFALIRARLPDRAIEVYGEILSREPEDVTALRRSAVAQILLSRWNDALGIAGRLERLPQGEVIGHTLAGVVYHDTARPEAAVAEFEHVLALDPDLLRMPLEPKEQFWIYLTTDLVALGRGEEARPYLARAMAERPDPYLDDLLGQTYWQEGSFEDARRCWLESIGRNPRRAQPWLRLGMLELQGGRPEEAVGRLARAAELAPSAREPYYSLSQAYARLGREDDARRCRSIADRLQAGLLPQPPAMGPPGSH